MTTPHITSEDMAATAYRVKRGGYTPSTQESHALANWERERTLNIAGMREADRNWYTEVSVAYDAAAAKMRADGWAGHPHPNIWRAATGGLLFTKGNRSAILVRNAGRLNWHPTPSALTPDRCLLWPVRDPPQVGPYTASD